MPDNLLNKFLVMLNKIPWQRDFWAKRYNAVQSETIPWTPLQKPLSQSKIALLTTGGVHLKSDEPFDMEDKRGDPSYRRLPATVDPAELMITHIYYDHSDADEDINLVFPIDILRHYQQQGVLGSSATNFYSFMGHIEEPHLETLINRTSKEVAGLLKQEGVDVALLVPA